MNKKIAVTFSLILILLSCRVSYQFNGASIDYSKVKTIDIQNFKNQALDVYPLLTQYFNEYIKDFYTRNTKLQIVDNQASDLELEGEITRYYLMPLAVQDNAYASQTRLTMEVRIRYRNNTNPDEDTEQTFSAYRDFASDELFTNVQDQLIEQLTKDIVDQIFNATLSKW